MPEYEPYAELVDWLERKWGYQRACPYCGTNKWVLGPLVRLTYFPPESESQSLFNGPEMFSVSCTNCGQTAFINRSAVEEDEDSEDEDES